MKEAIVGGIFALLGTILGYFLNEWSKHGVLKISLAFLEDFSDKYPLIETVEKYELKIRCHFNIYNTSSDSRVMRDITFQVLNNKEVICVENATAVEVASSISDFNASVVNNANIPPKQVCRAIICCSKRINDDTVAEKITSKNGLLITYKNEKGRTKKIKIENKTNQ